jgi:lysophospholipase L1-like esterase
VPVDEIATRPHIASNASESSESVNSEDKINEARGVDSNSSKRRYELVDGRKYSELFSTQRDPVSQNPSRISTRNIPVINKRPATETRNAGKKKVLYLHDSLGNSVDVDKFSSLLDMTKINMKTINNALKNWEQIAAASKNHDALIIGLGLNDIRTMAPDTAADKLFRLLDKLLVENTSIKILVSCLVPVFSELEENPYLGNHVKNYNFNIEELISEMRRGEALQDRLFTVFHRSFRNVDELNVEELYRNDGIHLTAAGTSKLASCLKLTCLTALKLPLPPRPRRPPRFSAPTRPEARATKLPEMHPTRRARAGTTGFIPPLSRRHL